MRRRWWGSDSQDVAELKRITERLRTLRSIAGSIWLEGRVGGKSPERFWRELLTGFGRQTRHTLRHRPSATWMLIATWHASRLWGKSCRAWKKLLVYTAVVGFIHRDRARRRGWAIQCGIRNLRERRRPTDECERYERGHGSCAHRSRAGHSNPEWLKNKLSENDRAVCDRGHTVGHLHFAQSSPFVLDTGPHNWRVT